jgi:L-cysteine:1D-myo-inositol 2-amino-2-deoxy-alpha-D-glucopyranoside ligase
MSTDAEASLSDTAQIRIYDTAKQQVVNFQPGQGPGGEVTIYVCGITPYDSAHIGHAAVCITFDVLARRLEDAGWKVRMVRNVTDVDDDILRKAKQLGVHYLDLAAEEIAGFRRDMGALGIKDVASEPRATSAIPEILTLIDEVLQAGNAYLSGGGVYFDVSSYPSYGSLSHLEREEMLELAKERGGRPEDPCKRDPLDFVMWQPSAPDEPEWDSRWGPGRPGWHVECSALAYRELGATIDLHGGGADLIFPHHESESAQSEAAHGAPLARHWMHVGMVRLQGEKMSKSLGNLVFVRDLLKTYDPREIRLAIESQHYRSSWEWSDELLEQARERLRRWKEAASRAHAAPGRANDEQDGSLPASEASELLEKVRQRLDDDLDLPGALLVIDEATSHGEDPTRAAALLGVDLERPIGLLSGSPLVENEVGGSHG